MQIGVISHPTLVSTFAGRTKPPHNLQKSFQGSAREKRNFKKCPTAKEDKKMNKTKKKIKYDCPTMAIRNAGKSAEEYKVENEKKCITNKG